MTVLPSWGETFGMVLVESLASGTPVVCNDDGGMTSIVTDPAVGRIARSEDAHAWSVAHARFPKDRKGQLTHQLAMKVSDSSWHRQLSELGSTGPGERNPYWLGPFQNYKAVCPYLVGSYDRVADELARYVDAGYRTFILDEPASAEEMRHVALAFEGAAARCPAT